MSVARAFISRAVVQCPRISIQFTPRLSTFSTHAQRFATSPEVSDKKPNGSSPPPSAADSKASANDKDKQADLNGKLKQLEELTAKNKELTATAADLKDKYVRALAEMENVRTRLRKEVENAKEFSIGSFSKDVLEVADLLELALRNIEPHLPKTGEAEGESARSTSTEANADSDPMRVFVQGVQMTRTTLNKMFAKHGLSSYEVARGAPFDPARHQALYQVPTEDAKQHATVADCVKLGYTLRERVLRPAFVGVFKKA